MPLTARLSLLFAATVAVLAARGAPLAGVVGVAIGGLAWSEPKALLPLFRPAFLLFAGGALLFARLAFGGAWAGLPVVGRGAAILALGAWAGGAASPFELARVAARIRLGWLGFALGVAINALPELAASLRRTWEGLRLRGGLRRNRARNLRLLAAATLANAIARADAQAEVAAARGFRLDLPPEPAPRWRVGTTLAVALAAIGALALLLLGR